MKKFINPWWDRRNETSPRYFEVNDIPIESVDVIDFYHYQGTVLGVINRSRAGGRGEDEVVTQCVSLDGAKRFCFGNWNGEKLLD